MKICIFGAGAIGGMLAAHLARTGAELALVARGPHLAAMQADGLAYESGGSTEHHRIRATADPAELGPQDYVVVTLKAQSVPPVVPQLRTLLDERSTVVWAVNGVPWWYFHGAGGSSDGRRLASVDPDGVQWDGIRPERVLGCIVYPAAEVRAPGVVHHLEGDRFSLGEPDGSRSDRAQEFAALLAQGGLRAPVRPRIRDELWVKLWGNLSFNPISALTGATLAEMAEHDGVRGVVREMMLEAQGIAEALGIRLPVSVDRRIDGAAEVGEHKTSMLQDLERGRAMEIDALVGAVRELGAVVGKPTPTIDLVHALVALRARLAGCYG